MLTRITAARRLPRVINSARFYSENPGSVAQSKGFNKKEQAHENEYSRRIEREQLEKLKKQIEAKKAELAKLEKEHNDVAEKAK